MNEILLSLARFMAENKLNAGICKHNIDSCYVQVNIK